MQIQHPIEKRLLAVEDNPLNLLVISHMLDASGYAYDAVDNGLKCLKLLNENHYDLVLTDIAMPGISGLQVAAEIRSMTDGKRDTPIIAMTANADYANIQLFVTAGISEVLAKPFSKVDFLRCIDRWL